MGLFIEIIEDCHDGGGALAEATARNLCEVLRGDVDAALVALDRAKRIGATPSEIDRLRLAYCEALRALGAFLHGEDA